MGRNKIERFKSDVKLKIFLSTKEYNRLKDIEEKYNYLIGQSFTICNGGRSRYATLQNMSKEEIIHRYFELNNYAVQLQRKLKDGDVK